MTGSLEVHTHACTVLPHCQTQPPPPPPPPSLRRLSPVPGKQRTVARGEPVRLTEINVPGTEAGVAGLSTCAIVIIPRGTWPEVGSATGI